MDTAFLYRQRARQLIDFCNLRVGSIMPTDSDGEIEYRDKAWIFFEIKYKDAQLSEGQRIAFERKIKDINRGGKQAVLFVAQHSVDNALENVDAAACVVRQIYYKGKWHEGDGSTLKEYVLRFVDYVDGRETRGNYRKAA